MIKSFFKGLSSSLIIFLLLAFIFLNCFTFFLINISNNYTSSLTEKDLSFSLALPPSIINTGLYFRVPLDSFSTGEETPLLLRCLFPSNSLLNFWRYNELNKPDMRSLVHPSHLTTPSPTEEEIFRQEIIFQEKKQRLRLAGQPAKFLVIDQTLSLLRDHLEIIKPLKPKGKLIVNSKHPRYCFPVSWPFFFKDGFGDPRWGNRLHRGIDIFAEEGAEVYAITDGVIHQLTTWNGGGNTLLLRGTDGRGYVYMHLQRYAAGISAGKLVKKGELIAYVGHTGTISSSPHLHFQVHTDQNFSKECALNPYEALVSLCQGHGVTDLGRPKPHFSQVRGLNQQVFSSGIYRRAYFLTGERSTSIKPTLIEIRNGVPDVPRETGLVRRVPHPNWKVPRADLLIPDEKSRTPSSSTRVTRNWPKRKPSAKFLYP